MVVTNLLALGRKEYFFNVVNVFLYYLPLEWAKLLYHTSNKVLDPIQHTIYNVHVFSFNQMCSSSSAESEVSIFLCIFKYRPAIGISRL